MPTQQSRTTLTNLRTFIAGQLDSIGRPEWSARFLDGFTDGSVQATVDEIELLRTETWAVYLAAWDGYWEAAQNDMWAGATDAGLTGQRVSDVIADTDKRAATVLKAMMCVTSMLLMRHRYETR